MKKPDIEKHIETIINTNVLLDFPLYGNFRARIFGRIIGRIRNRFKQYIFIPTIPFSSFQFASSDVNCIELEENVGVIIKIKNIEKSPRKRKKKKEIKFPVVAPEPDMVIDLNEGMTTPSI